MTEEDVERAFKYWARDGLVRQVGDNPVSFTLFNLKQLTLTRAETRNTEPAYMASAEIRLLGLLSPEYGAAYDSRLHLQVRNSGGEMYSASVNMNGTLTDIIRLYAGELPADETVEVELGINLLNAVLTAEVKGWTEGSGEGGVGDYKRKVFYDKRERIMYE